MILSRSGDLRSSVYAIIDDKLMENFKQRWESIFRACNSTKEKPPHKIKNVNTIFFVLTVFFCPNPFTMQVLMCDDVKCRIDEKENENRNLKESYFCALFFSWKLIKIRSEDFGIHQNRRK